ncbi:hypothetical protein ACT4UT_14475, partial [Bacillus sp. B-TM1]
MQALISQAMGDMVSLQHALNDFVQVSLQPCENLDLTLGKSSTLLACSQLLDVLPDNDLIDLQALLNWGQSINFSPDALQRAISQFQQ